MGIYLGFGEIMMRVAPEGRLRLAQALPGKVGVTYAGAEANVCVSLARLGEEARFATALPESPLAEPVRAVLGGHGVELRALYRERGRLGVFFFEYGADRRPAEVIYDREGSAIALAAPSEYDFEGALAGAGWLHISGITPALSENAFLSVLELARRAKAARVPVSCDLNFRGKLWGWKPGVPAQSLARECMARIMPNVDLLLGSAEGAAIMLDAGAEGTEIRNGRFDAEAVERTARETARRFKNLARIGFTLRECVSAVHNNFGGMLFDAKEDKAFFAPLDASGRPVLYEIRDIVDPLGAGDAFAAGLIKALNDAEFSDPQRAIAFAAAAGCLKHSVHGDFNLVGRDEIEGLALGRRRGSVSR